uniref:PDZ domain-containing protein n=1 Tax=Oxyrrhis marina TaxID=2969 RepID=A0A7S3XH20_OXYMA
MGQSQCVGTQACQNFNGAPAQEVPEYTPKWDGAEELENKADVHVLSGESGDQQKGIPSMRGVKVDGAADGLLRWTVDVDRSGNEMLGIKLQKTSDGTQELKVLSVEAGMLFDKYNTSQSDSTIMVRAGDRMSKVNEVSGDMDAMKKALLSTNNVNIHFVRR